MPMASIVSAKRKENAELAAYDVSFHEENVNSVIGATRTDRGGDPVGRQKRLTGDREFPRFNSQGPFQLHGSVFHSLPSLVEKLS